MVFPLKANDHEETEAETRRWSVVGLGWVHVAAQCIKFPRGCISMQPNFTAASTTHISSLRVRPLNPPRLCND